MKRSKVLGVSRSERFSPHSVERDGSIFRAVAEALERQGHEVETVGEDELRADHLPPARLVFSMARGEAALTLLAEAERGQRLQVVNSAAKLLEMTRDRILLAFEAQRIPQPPYEIVDRAARHRLPFPFWLKRADACAQQPGDVSFVQTEEEWERAVARFAARGIRKAVAAGHQEGDLIKFYGVEGTGFFHVKYANEQGSFSKFGLEAVNGAPHHYAFSLARLKQTADRAAVVTGFLVYGGDAVVSPDGQCRIIDFNDWPSFSACGEAAAQAIVQRLSQLLPRP